MARKTAKEKLGAEAKASIEKINAKITKISDEVDNKTAKLRDDGRVKIAALVKEREGYENALEVLFKKVDEANEQ